jgi:O-Antigen ligase
MSSLTLDTMRRSGSTVASRSRGRFFSVLCVSLVVQSLFTFIYHLTGSPAFYAISNTIAIALIGYALVAVLRSKGDGSAGTTFLVISVVAVLLSVMANAGNTSITTVLKYLSLYIFYAAGTRNRSPLRSFELYCLCALAALPIAFMAVGTSKIWEWQEEPFGYLPNANVAVLHFCALLFAATPAFGNRVILLQLLNAAFMNKIGAIVATAISICMWVTVPLRRESILSAVAILAPVLAICVAAYQFGAFDRVIIAFDGLVFALKIDPRSVVSMSYRDLVQLTGSTDLSGFFRLIHWTNIWDIYCSGGIGTWIFGYGAGQTSALTYAGMVPHNDYLRILVEYGLINLVIFVCFLAHVRTALTTSAASVLFVVLCIYFFSENLLDSFTSMTLFFAYAGRMTAGAPVAASVRTLNRDLSQ